MRQYHSAGRRTRTTTTVLRGLTVITVLASASWSTTPAHATQSRVHASFGLSQPSKSPFPTNWHTVNDSSNLTGIRVNLPVPDCSVRPSDCDDIAVLNSLDGFNLQPRVSIPFDGTIDVDTATSSNLFLVDIDHDEIVESSQLVWDPDTTTLHVESDNLLRQHTRYAVIVTRGIRDSQGRNIEATQTFRSFLADRCSGERECAYQQALREGLDAAAGLGTPAAQVASASVFTTLSSTAVMEKIRDQIKAKTPDAIDFRLGPDGSRTMFTRNAINEIWFDRQMRVDGGLSPVRLDLAPLAVVPDTVGSIAYGKFSSSDYQTQPAVFPTVGTRTGVPKVQRVNELYCTLILPSGQKPAAGWPVMILAHAGTQHKDDFALRHAAIAASHGIATLAINAVGHGFGSRSELRLRLTDGSEVAFPSGGRGIDQDGGGVIANREGDRPEAPYTILWERDALRQTAADLLQLVRQVEVGVDVDGDNEDDLDADRTYLAGFSLGSNYGALAATVDPSVQAMTLNVPGGALVELLRLGPARRPVFGMHLQQRVPSLLNSPGIDELDGVPVGIPTWNENKPLRQSPSVVNTVAGAMPIQELIDRTEWAFQSGNSLAYAPHLQRDPLQGVPTKAVLLQFAKGDQTSPNPAMTAFLRASGLAKRTTFYRNDLAFEKDNSIPKNPHGFLNNPTSLQLAGAVSRGAQQQMGTFFASRGEEIITPEDPKDPKEPDPLDGLFEVPIAQPLPENLSFIP
jgi:Alpha/beta hydrolase family